MDIYAKEGVLLLVQVDHLSGELLGDALNVFYDLGARNVNIVASVTKKNRPGHLILIDTPLSALSVIEHAIVEELGVSGWHRTGTEHLHLRVEAVAKEIEIPMPSGACVSFTVKGKKIYGRTVTVRPENASCLALRDILILHGGIRIPISSLIKTMSDILESETGNNKMRISEIVGEAVH